jgi:hypothetical protein
VGRKHAAPAGAAVDGITEFVAIEAKKAISTPFCHAGPVLSELAAFS